MFFFIIIFIVEFAFKLWSREPRSITNKKTRAIKPKRNYKATIG